MTQDEYNDLVNTVQQLTVKTDTLADSIARVDTKVENTKYITRLLDVNVQYPAENDVLVYDKTGKWKNAQYDEIGLLPGEGGESNVYVIGIGDETSPTNENVYAAARTIEDFISSKNTDTAEGTITFNSGIVTNNINSISSSEGTFGSGLIFKTKSDGKAYLELDELLVRVKANFNTLEIQKTSHVGGNILLTPASMKCSKVEKKSTIIDGQSIEVFRCYFEDQDGDNAIKNDFQVNDLVRCQSFNIQEGIYEGITNKYYWRKVLSTGANYIDLSVDDHDSSSNDEPSAGDEIVQFGNTSILSRQNAIELSSYGEQSPSIRLYQGINDYSLNNKAIIEMAYDNSEEQEQAYFNVYGRMYVGTKDKSTSYIKYDPTENDGNGLLTVKAKIIVESESGDVTLIEGGKIKTDLIDADNIVASIGIWTNQIQVGDNFTVTSDGTMTAKNTNITGIINATSGTFNNVSINSGNIGAFNISNSLSSGTNGEGDYVELSSSSLYFRSNYGNKDIRASFGANGSGVLPGSSGMSMPIGIYRNISNSGSTWDENVGLFISCNGGHKYNDVSYSGNIAIDIESGFIRGLRLNVKALTNITSSENYYQLTDSDNYVLVYDGCNGVNLPDNPQEGQLYIIRKANTHGVIYVNSSYQNIIQGENPSVSAVKQCGIDGWKAIVAVYTKMLKDSNDRGYWWINTLWQF